MWIGSLRLLKLPASKNPSLFAGSAFTRPASGPSSRSAAATASGRARRILLDRRVHVVEQPHVLRPDVDFHAVPLHRQRSAAQRDETGRGDEVTATIVGGLAAL